MLETVNPATGEVLATFPVHGRREVDAAVTAAREAAGYWSGLGWAGRRIRLLAWKSYLVRYMGRLAELMHEETGKPLDDAKLEIILAVLHIDWAARHAKRVLRPRRVRSGLFSIHQAATLEYQPLGVVGVIGPWNYPVFTPVGSIAYALAAGNAVVFKPSELTPATGAWLVRSFGEAMQAFGNPVPVLQLVTGPGSTGEALARSGVAKIAFTGSAATARKVMAAAADTLTPVLAECGGKDALLIAADADLDAAADAAAWGAMSNAGQTCVGIERVYVADAVYHSFLERLTQRVSGLRPGSDPEASYGPMTLPSQTGVVAKHVADALARGGRPVVGGTDAVSEPYVQPVILTDVPENALAVSDETFGPTLTVRSVVNMAEAVSYANAGRYGL
ncbi:MAG: aldehyde dehydrogenase family protein, partial [Streptosporangiaceae bacterium]